MSRLALASLLLLITRPALTRSDPQGIDAHAAPLGVVLESVEKGTPADTAGLRPGDVLVSWRPALDREALDVPTGGPLTVPFDLERVEIEVAPRMPVLLAGERGGHPLEVRVTGGEWRVTSRPLLDERDSEAYSLAETLARDGKVDAALAEWRAIAEAAAARNDWTLACWLTVRMAERAEPGGAAPDPFALAPDTCASTGRADRIALAQQALARAWQARRRYPEAEAAWREALRLWQGEASPGLQVAGVYHGLGLLFSERGRPVEAEIHFRHALDLRQSLAPEGLEVAATLHHLGVVIPNGTDIDAASVMLARALEIRDRLAPDSLLVPESLVNLAKMVKLLGRFEEAQELAHRALASASRIEPGGPLVGTIELELGTAAALRGDRAVAERHYRQALAIGERVAPDGLLVASSLNNLANVAKARGDWDAAEVLYQRAVAHCRHNWPEGLATAGVLANFGLALAEQGRFVEADAVLREALAVGEKAAPRSPTFAFILVSVAELNYSRGDLATAEAVVDRVLRLMEGPDWTAPLVDPVSLLKGEVMAAQGKLTEAEIWFRKAIVVAERLLDDERLALALRGLAKVHRERGRTSEAADAYGRAIEALEAQRARLGGGGQGRMGFGVRHAQLYQEAIETMLGAGRPEEAFHYFERSRARAFLEMLAERDLALDADLPAELRRRRRSLDAAYDRTQAALSAAKESDKQDQLLARLRQLRVEQQETADQARRASPRLAAVAYPQPLTLQQARQALDPGTALLAYSVGPQRTVLFVLAPDSPTAKGAEVETVVIPLGSEALQRRVAAWRRETERSAPSPQFFAEARALYDLLIRPLEGLLSPAKRLVICPDGPLHQLPFAALRRDGAYLIEWKPLTFVSSGTVLAQLVQSRPASPSTAGLVAFGDPRAPGLPRLIGGRREVAAITSLFPGARAYLGAEATEERMAEVGKGARYLHFALHGVLNERLPLESALAFSPAQSETGRDSGLLYAWEIFERVRLDADLVTLSACRSAAGTEVAGEGVLGLTRAFQYAGARSVVASLWRVPDKSTLPFMSRLYGSLKRGLDKDAALRRAQLASIRAGHHPVRWASFQLYGDSR
jgi:CHAT domain-containing protein/Tfp pilus assembly protein PilF